MPKPIDGGLLRMTLTHVMEDFQEFLVVLKQCGGDVDHAYDYWGDQAPSSYAYEALGKIIEMVAEDTNQE